MAEKKTISTNYLVLQYFKHGIRLIFCYIYLSFSLGSFAFAGTLYMGINEQYTNLTDAIANMASGDTLIIRDGDYTGSNNVLIDSNFPPNGSPEQYTTIKAENNGKVTFDGESSRYMFLVYGGRLHQYIQFEGIKWIDSPGTNGGHVVFMTGDHFKFIRCGAKKSAIGEKSVGFYINASSYFLLEECYAWGNARYGIEIYHSNRGIIRRNVVRNDAADGAGVPVAGIINYASANMEYQNNIVLDSDNAFFSNDSYDAGGLAIRQSHTVDSTTYYSEDIFVRGNIVLNYKTPYGGTLEDRPTGGLWSGHDNNAGHPIRWENNVAWDVSMGFTFGTDSGRGEVVIDHVTIKVLDHPTNMGEGINASYNQDGIISNCVILDADHAGIVRFFGTLTHNLLYNNASNYSETTVGASDYVTERSNETNPIYNSSTNPTGGLKYIVRVEDGSNISSLDSAGSKVGATIINKTGVDGTLFGETGYNTLTSDSLWPFPYEDQIRLDFRSYNPGGSDQSEPDGERGFCVTGQTLTKYIWEYLGNTIPPGIYVETPIIKSIVGR